MKTKILRNTFLNLGMIFGLAIAARAQNLYVSLQGPLTNFGGSISEYTPTGVQETFASAPFPRGVAFDNSGIFFVASTDAKVFDHARVLKFAPNGHQSVLGNAAQGFFEGLVTDTAGNVYAVAVEDKSPALAGIIYKFAPDGTRTVFAGPSAFTSTQVPAGLAFDARGNLFVSTLGNRPDDAILVFTPTGMESTFATGLNNPHGMAFDAAGNLFVTETLWDGAGDILEFTTGGAKIVFASGLNRPEYLAFGPPR